MLALFRDLGVDLTEKIVGLKCVDYQDDVLIFKSGLRLPFAILQALPDVGDMLQELIVLILPKKTLELYEEIKLKCKKDSLKLGTRDNNIVINFSETQFQETTISAQKY